MAFNIYVYKGVAGCYTDFHVDFGGSSVWYHVMKGQKRFFLIEPTPENLQLFEAWNKSSKQTEFFADRVDRCYDITLQAGQTLLIPTGWIHAVFTPKDAFVFGGNFLHSLNIAGQLRINILESRLGIADAYRYPNFMRLQWFAAAAMLDALRFEVKKNMCFQNNIARDNISLIYIIYLVRVRRTTQLMTTMRTTIMGKVCFQEARKWLVSRGIVKLTPLSWLERSP